MDSPITIADRQELIYLLVEAAELEHSVCCTYLFAAFSLKSGTDEGLTPVQALAVASWRKAIIDVASTLHSRPRSATSSTPATRQCCTCWRVSSATAVRATRS